jgi:UDP-N-acetylglucosamine--N-acetylmuramyl-(pentapeptide) pyrophosphoryl-undecaprenol N-acetylglucosamine transferase
MIKILFTGGGTAGHIFPIVAIIREIKKIYPNKDIKFFYIGPKDPFVKNILVEEGVEVKTILAGKLRRYFSPLNIIDIFFKFPIGIIQAFFHIFVISPDLIFSKGGYGSLPVVICGWIFLTPIFIHESDVVPGLANKIASKFALEIFTAFPVEKVQYFPIRKMICVGNPIRKEILNGSLREAQTLFKLTGEKPVVLVLGGSQGSQRINDKILTVLRDFLENFELIHQTGSNNFNQVKAEADTVIGSYSKPYYHPVAFLNDEELAHAYKAADFIISRAGAGSIFEIAAIGKPSILIPLPESAQNHQLQNAYAFSENGASIVLEEENFLPHFLLETLKNLFSQPKRIKQMGERALEFSKPESARIIGEYLISYLIQ